MSWIQGLPKITLQQDRVSITQNLCKEFTPSMYTGSFISPNVFFVSPLNPTKTEDLGTISDSGISIFFNASSWIMFTELQPSTRILRTKQLAIQRVMTKPSW